MLWYKAWLETRLRFLFLAALMLAACVLFVRPLHPARDPGGEAARLVRLLYFAEWPMLALVLAGAGINTQTLSGTRHAIHPSMYFTLSLPVRRRRLVAVRAAVGALETLALVLVGCFAGWTLSPLLRAIVAPAEMLVYVFTAAAGASLAYGLGVLLATFLDESWQIYAGAAALAPLWLLQTHVPGLAPPPFGEVRWMALAFSAGGGAVLVAAAAWCAERKQY